jgi:Mn-dependent DtxR family transcriptional regulator
VEYLRQTHRRPGARLSVDEQIECFGTDPAVAMAISELAVVGYIAHADTRTIRLTAFGFDAHRRNDY